MNLHTKISFLLITISFLFIYSCQKKQQYPLIPNIEFQSYSLLADARGVDTTLILIFSFTDDGDIGLGPGDTVSPYVGQYKYDFFAAYYEVQYGKLTLVKTPTNFNQRLPLVTINGSNKNIKGTIQVNLPINDYNTSKFDTIAFQVYIVDRALNKSNVVMSPDIIVVRK